MALLGKAAIAVTLREPSAITITTTITIAYMAAVWSCRTDPPGQLVSSTLSLGVQLSPVVMELVRREAVLMRLRWAVVEVVVL